MQLCRNGRRGWETVAQMQRCQLKQCAFTLMEVRAKRGELHHALDLFFWSGLSPGLCLPSKVHPSQAFIPLPVGYSAGLLSFPLKSMGDTMVEVSLEGNISAFVFPLPRRFFLLIMVVSFKCLCMLAAILYSLIIFWSLIRHQPSAPVPFSLWSFLPLMPQCTVPILHTCTRQSWFHPTS